MINPQQIRKALVRLAEYKQRDYYTPIAVREIINNFETHPLKGAILYFCEHDPREYMARFRELKAVCKTRNRIDALSLASGYDVALILKGDTFITDNAWLCLQKYFDEVDRI